MKILIGNIEPRGFRTLRKLLHRAGLFVTFHGGLLWQPVCSLCMFVYGDCVKYFVELITRATFFDVCY